MIKAIKGKKPPKLLYMPLIAVEQREHRQVLPEHHVLTDRAR